MHAPRSHTPDLDARLTEHDASAPTAGCDVAADAIRVPRLSLIEIIKLVLADLHDRRRRSENYTHSEQIEEKIKIWEDALDRLKELSGRYVSLQEEDLPPQFC